MRLVIFRSLAVLAAGAALLVGVLYIASTVDARAPEVISFELTQPLPDDPDTALITTSLEITFNEPVRVDPGTEPITIEPAIEGTSSFSGATLIFTPAEPLDLETEYVATVGTGIRDQAGNRIAAAARTFSFDTAGAPLVVATAPEDGAVGVAVDGPIRITFSTLMDTTSVERALRIRPALPHELVWSGETLEVIPTGPLDPDTSYELIIGTTAADVAGVPIGGPVAVTFHTVGGGLEPVVLVPAADVAGIAPATPIAVLFDRPIDGASLGDAEFRVEPEVAGSLEVVTLDGEPLTHENTNEGSVLRFTPSGPLPLNTTFDVFLGPGLRGLDGGVLADAVEWSFTTGAPSATVSNQITFISERGGIANVWAVNPDGSGLRQVSTEISPVLDYAATPDGSRVVVGDGRRLVAIRSDGSGRVVLTDDRHIEFDPAFDRNGDRLVFGRADVASGAGMGLWMAASIGSDATRVEIDPDGSGGGDGGTGADARALLRAPRFSPDGEAVAYVDAAGSVAIFELSTGSLTSAPARAVGPPHWLPDATGVLVTLAPEGDEPAVSGPDVDGRMDPLRPAPGEAGPIGRLDRSDTEVAPLGSAAGALAGVRSDGTVAYVDAAGEVRLVDARGEPQAPDSPAAGPGAVHAAFGPSSSALILELDGGGVEVLDLASGERLRLSDDGRNPGWLP